MPDDVDGVLLGVIWAAGLAKECEGCLAGDVELLGVVAGEDENGASGGGVA